MPEKMTETEFQELICDLWTKYGETWEKGISKTASDGPNSFQNIFLGGCQFDVEIFGN